MKSLTFQRKKENLDFLLQTIRYFFDTDKKPKFESKILKDQSFFSLVKNTYTLGYVFEVFKDDPEFNNSWLYEELKRYINFYKNKEARNNRMINDLEKIATEHKIDIAFLKDYNYKTLSGYTPTTRFSNDIDILMRQRDMFKFDEIVTQKKFGLRFINFELGFKPHLALDENIDFVYYTQNYLPLSQQEQLRYGIKSGFRHFTYGYFEEDKVNGLLEIHFYPNNYHLSNNDTRMIEIIWNNIEPQDDSRLYRIKPEARIIYDTDHFISHFRYAKIYDNGLSTFLGHLERICDLAYNISLEKEIDWNTLNNIARELHMETELFFYLSLGKEYLNLPIPDDLLQSLKKESNILKRMFLSHVDINKLFQDKQSFIPMLYGKLFPKRKF